MHNGVPLVWLLIPVGLWLAALIWLVRLAWKALRGK